MYGIYLRYEDSSLKLQYEPQDRGICVGRHPISSRVSPFRAAYPERVVPPIWTTLGIMPRGGAVDEFLESAVRCASLKPPMSHRDWYCVVPQL